MSEGAIEDPVAALEDAQRSLDEATAAVESVGADRVERVADAYERFDDLLSSYRERASGSGRETFQAYVTFEGELDEFTDGIPGDLLHREAFEEAESLLDRRRLEERDFDRAREALGPAREVAELLEERAAAEARLRERRHAVQRRRREVEAEIANREDVLAFEDVDFDAPVERLREPVEAYEAAVDEAFETFRATEPARAVLDFLDATDAYPLVDVPEPPADLRRYLRRDPAGEEPVATLLEWAEFTRSKLGHYVDDPAAFRTHVAGNRTYLARLDAGPLHVGWPPPPAGELRFLARELVPLVERFADAGTVERLHAVRAVARDPDYERCRRVAVVRDELSEDEVRRLRDGSVREELAALRDRRDRLARALESHPAP